MKGSITLQLATIATILASTITNVVAFGPTLISATNKNTAVHMSDGSTNGPDIRLDPKETAVILIEYQNEFTTEGGALHGAVKDCMEATKTLENSKTLVDAARDAGCTIIHVPIAFDEVRKNVAIQKQCRLKILLLIINPFYFDTISLS